MSEIRPNLFLGSRGDARDNKLRAISISNVLSIEWAKPHLPADISNKFVYVDDDPDADLLSLMPQCVQFIEDSVENGGVLVHCFMGISRSSTIVAAYLMKNENISFDDALVSIRKARPQARPNFGFRQQLDLFREMNFTVDKENKKYKSHLLRELGLNFRDFPDIIQDEVDCSEDKTFSEVDLAAIAVEYEDVFSRCRSIAKENVESSFLEWLVSLRQFLRKHRRDISDYMPLDVQTRGDR
ncbi:uncharacterized protein [Antedon mediterranea]|uniref:uncharacterized protein isoform X2 n=1 Tax=Antedon mediterranea TaxID=105859 RepID=UPI003AF6EA0C